MPALQRRQQLLLDHIAELELQLAATGSRALSHADAAARITAFAHETASRLEAMTFAQRQQLLRTILEKVVVTGDRVELFFKIPLPPPTQPRGPSPRRNGGRLRSERLDAVRIDDQCVGQAAELEQPLEVRRAAGESRDLQPEDGTHLANADSAHQLFEAGTN